MYLSLKNNLLFLIFILYVSTDQPSKSDEMCKSLRGVLCVKDVLMAIAMVAKSINRTANEIERYILNRMKTSDTLNRYVNFEMNLIHSLLPTPQYHVQFLQLNNIDKKYLSELFLEAHYAMSYYYNSIEAVLNMNDVHASTIDSWFRQITLNLQREMICQYRNILDVYSHEWPSINQINRIEFSQRKYRNAPSLIHDIHSIIITRLIRESMQRIHTVMINLEAKFV